MPSFVENVNKVATNLTTEFINGVVAVSGSLPEVHTVASNINDINSVVDTVIPNLPEILLADDNAVIATTQAGIATTQASIATTKADEASTSAAAALVSEQNAVSLLDQFDDRYLGSKVSDPLADNDGNVLLDGALYWNTTTSQMMVYDLGNLVWLPALTLSANSEATLINKTIDDISNTVGADHVHYKCRNTSGTTIPRGVVVTAQGTQSDTDYIEIVPVTDPQTQIALGITHTELSNNGTGLVINTGVVDSTNTSTWAVGTILYPNSTGGLTSTKPTAGRYQACAVVLRQHSNQGTLLCEFTEPKYIASTTQAGYVQLDTTPTDGSINGVTSNGVFDALSTKADKDVTSGAVFLGSGTTLQRPTLLSTARAMWYNTDLNKFEGWNGTQWVGVGGGATGGGADTVFVETSYTVTQDYTITAGKSAITVGDASGNVTINDGVTVTIPDNSVWVIQGA